MADWTEGGGMNRSTGGGLLAFSIVLIVVGAILQFAVSVTTKGFNINTIGMILLIVGIVTFLISLFVLFSGGSRRSTMHEDVRSVPGGQQRTVEQQDNFGSDV
jgi:beta-lactamase regulating signal transducer with metallopeptidase domain